MRIEEKQVNNRNKDRRRRFVLLDLKVKIIVYLSILITIANLVIMYCSFNTYKVQRVIAQGEKAVNVEINNYYDNEDIAAIETIRKFFLFYYEAEEYDIVPNLQIMTSDKAKEVINQAQILIGKYGEILLDMNKKLTFDTHSRNMKITSGAFELELYYFNVDIPFSLSDYNIILTCNGSWKGKDNDYVFYKFGQAIEGSLISTSLRMLDLRTVTFNNEKTYKEDSPIYLFKERRFSSYSTYYVYVVKTGEFREIPNVKEIKATDEFVSFEDKDNNLFVYCIQHDYIIKAGETQEQGLYWTYDPEIYLPESFNDILKKELFIAHKQCNK